MFSKVNKTFLFILLLAVFLRFWKLAEFFTFNFDEEYQALLAWEQVKNFHPIWIGVSASNLNYYLGPGFTYLNAFLFFLSKDPLILAFFASSLGIVTTISIYFVAKKLFSPTVATYATAFYTGSLFLNLSDRRFWNPTPIPLFSISMLFFLYQALKNPWWLLVITFLMGLALHIHLSLLAFWLAILYVIWNIRNKITVKIGAASVLGFLLATFPLLIFDLNHNFDNFLMPVRYIQKMFLINQGESNVLGASLQFVNTLSRVWYLRPFSNIQDEFQLGIHGSISQTNWIIAIFSLFLLVWFFLQSLRKQKYNILTLVCITMFLVYIFYPGGVVAYFLLGFLALFSIIIGITFSRMPKMIGITIMVVLFALNTFSLLTLQQEQFGLQVRKKLIKEVMNVVGRRSFYLETRTLDKRKYHSAGGWRYLFKVYGRTPSQSHADEFFGWIYPDEIAKTKPNLRVIISEYPAKVREKPIAEFNQGVYYGYITINN